MDPNKTDDITKWNWPTGKNYELQLMEPRLKGASTSQIQRWCKKIIKKSEKEKEKQSQIESLADAICYLLDWQSRQLQRKADARIKAMQRRYRDKVIENKRLL